MWKQTYIKFLRNRLINPVFKKNIHAACVAQSPEIDHEDMVEKFYTIELDNDSIKNLLNIQNGAPEIICPICFGNGWISCPACKSGCRQCNNLGHIDCPLCHKFNFKL